jgi:hypothetical protein
LNKEGHCNLSILLNLKRPMDVPYEYIQTRAYDINIGAWICMSKLFSLETNMSKGVGEQ